MFISSRPVHEECRRPNILPRTNQSMTGLRHVRRYMVATARFQATIAGPHPSECPGDRKHSSVTRRSLFRNPGLPISSRRLRSDEGQVVNALSRTTLTERRVIKTTILLLGCQPDEPGQMLDRRCRHCYGLASRCQAPPRDDRSELSTVLRTALLPRSPGIFSSCPDSGRLSGCSRMRGVQPSQLMCMGARRSHSEN